MSNPISKAVLDAITPRLADNSQGFNETFNMIADDYGLQATMAIQFTASADGTSPNFAKVNVSPEDWVDTSALKWPFVTLFVDHIVNQNKQKFMNFSGDVIVGLNVFLSWPQSRVIIDFDSLASCVEETVVTVFNRATGANDQLWGDLETTGADIVYNGDINCTRSRVTRGQEFWEQLLAFKATFEVHSRGTN